MSEAQRILVEYMEKGYELVHYPQEGTWFLELAGQKLPANPGAAAALVKKGVAAKNQDDGTSIVYALSPPRFWPG
jgi:hypothetical protein